MDPQLSNSNCARYDSNDENSSSPSLRGKLRWEFSTTRLSLRSLDRQNPETSAGDNDCRDDGYQLSLISRVFCFRYTPDLCSHKQTNKQKKEPFSGHMTLLPQKKGGSYECNSQMMTIKCIKNIKLNTTVKRNIFAHKTRD